MEKKKKIVVFSGAGISAESGLETFRGLKNSMWNNYNIDEVASPQGWKKNREKVLDFYNERRRELINVNPNEAHIGIAKLEEKYDITVITQNVDDLHERAGSTHVIHLHGELKKARGSLYNNKFSPLEEIIDIGYNDINIGDKCPISGSQLRPHIVWFGEYPLGLDEAYECIYNADILVIIGTSLQITYTIDLLSNVRQRIDNKNNPCRIIYIDLDPAKYLDEYELKVEYVKKTATEGVNNLVKELLYKEDL